MLNQYGSRLLGSTCTHYSLGSISSSMQFRFNICSTSFRVQSPRTSLPNRFNFYKFFFFLAMSTALQFGFNIYETAFWASSLRHYSLASISTALQLQTQSVRDYILGTTSDTARYQRKLLWGPWLNSQADQDCKKLTGRGHDEELLTRLL